MDYKFVTYNNILYKLYIKIIDNYDTIDDNDKNLIELQELNIKIDKTDILRNVSLEIKQSNTITCITGVSGCGKTTLLNAIYNDLPSPYITTGIIKRCKNIKFIGRTTNFNPYLSVNEIINMYMNCYNKYNNSHNNRSENINNMLGKFNLGSLKQIGNKFTGNDSDNKNGYLSTGELIRLFILVNILDTPDVLLLDEPFANLDMKNSVDLIKILKRLNIPIILTIHSLNDPLLKHVNQLIMLDKLDENIENTVKYNLLIEYSNEFKITNRVGNATISANTSSLMDYYTKLIINEENDDFEPNNNVNNMVNFELYDVENNMGGGTTTSILAEFTLIDKIFFTFYNVFWYIVRNKKYITSCLLIYIIYPIVSGLFMTNLDYSDGTNGYIRFISVNYIYLSIITPLNIISIIDYQNVLYFMKNYIKLNLSSHRICSLIYLSINAIIDIILRIILLATYCIIYQQNFKIFNDMLQIHLIDRCIMLLYIHSLLCLLEGSLIISSYLTIFNLYQSVNCGIFSSNKYAKYTSLTYYYLNILSVKAQQIYNYDLLPDGKYVYSIYDYDSDISHYYVYIFSFLIIPIIIYAIPKSTNMFVS